MKTKAITVNVYLGVDFAKAHYILCKHYDIGRELTTAEAKAEIDSLIRKHKKGSLDYVGEYLYACIFS